MPRDPRPRQRGQRVAQQINASKLARHRRSLEAYATSRWAVLRQKDKHSYVTDIIALGDFDRPKVVPDDSFHDALVRRGLRRPEHSSKIASTIPPDKQYDQIMFFPGQTKHAFSGNSGVFDYDGTIFAKLWHTKTKAEFRAYLRYYISDHRPIWAEFKI